MSEILDEMKAVMDGDEDALKHYGVLHRSGRYPWGSGENPYQHSQDFLGRIEELKKRGWTETPENIKKEFDLTTSEFRNEKSIATDVRRSYQVARAKSLQADGKNTSEIAREMGVNESTIRSYFDKEREIRMNQSMNTAKFLKQQVDERGLIDVGKGTEYNLGVTAEKLDTALYILESDGYVVVGGRAPQVTGDSGRKTTLKVLGPPGTPKSAAYDYEHINSLEEYITRDGGDSYEKKFHYPASLDGKRLKVLLKDEVGPDGETGVQKDGVIQIRRGVEDLSLGESRYAQVRILVDGTHYLKGMAVYSDNLPDGVDVLFNSNKTSREAALKPIKDDPDNPFGSAIKDAKLGGQYWYTDSKTGEKKLGLINKRSDQGDWTEWKDALPSQFLSKQSTSLAKKQLDLAKEDKIAEYNEIMEFPNPTIRKHLLSKFADSCDAAAVNLQAAALPGQKYHVIVPINTLSDTEVFAPQYDNGTKLALVRYPHGGTFEIPILTVNNNNKTARSVIGSDSIDAIGITKSVADRLSGADFDGDTVMAIPTHDPKGRVKIKSTDPLKGLEGFDPKDAYQWSDIKEDADGTKHYYRGGREFKTMSKTGTQNQMGRISNLITDMTLQGATSDELARAVRHSMVVIDAEKHKLDYHQSEADNGIEELRKKYQEGGASTLISRSKGETTVLKRQGTPKINQKGKDWYDPTRPEGALIYKVADDVDYSYTKTDKRTGAEVLVEKQRTQKSTRMAETDDARTLISKMDTKMENLYADYANSMKDLANKARLELATTSKIAYDVKAKETYSKEVQDLTEKLEKAEANAPKERFAQIKANVVVNSKKQAYKEKTGKKMPTKEVKKIAQQALTKFREEIGSASRKERNILITDREWEAIQSGAISENKLVRILNNTDIDALRERVAPREKNGLSTSQINRMKAMSASNYTLSEIARKLGISTSTVSKYLKGDA